MRSIHRKQDQGSAPAPSTQHSFCCHLIPVPHSTQVAVTVGRKWINERQAPRLRAQHCFEPDRRKKSKVFSGQSTSREVTLSSWKCTVLLPPLFREAAWKLKKKKKRRIKKKRPPTPPEQQQNERTPNIPTPQHPQIVTARTSKCLLLVAVQDFVLVSEGSSSKTD